jgi:hypothetical protein
MEADRSLNGSYIGVSLSTEQERTLQQNTPAWRTI